MLSCYYHGCPCKQSKPVRLRTHLPGIVGDGVASASVVNVPLHEPTTVVSLAVSVTLIE